MNMKALCLSARFFVFSAMLSLLSQTSYAAEQTADPTPMHSTKHTSDIDQKKEWRKEHIILASTVVVASGAALIYYLMPPSERTISTPPTPVHYPCIDVPQAYLEAIAKNVTTSVEGYVSEITGWISECYNPSLYDKNLGKHYGRPYTTFEECNESCWSGLEYVGYTTRACYNLIECLARNGSNILSCKAPFAAWRVTLQDSEELMRSSLWGFPSWYGITSGGLDSINSSHPQYQFHYDVNSQFSVIDRRWWECGAKLVTPNS